MYPEIEHLIHAGYSSTARIKFPLTSLAVLCPPITSTLAPTKSSRELPSLTTPLT